MSEVIYGVKSIMISDANIDGVNHIEYDKFISKPIPNRMGGIQFSKSFTGSFSMNVSDLSPKVMRQLFGNSWNKPPKEIVCRFKLKDKAYARPVYQTFVFPKHSVDTPEKLRSITKFVRACYK